MNRVPLLLLLIAGTIGVIINHGLRHENPLPDGLTIDSLHILKKQRKMSAFSAGKLVKTYSIALGSNPEGHKEVEGDGRTPEGTYFISSKSTESRFHMNLGVSYPDSSDVSNARHRGLAPGGDIKVHGLRTFLGVVGRYHTLVDWTAGCVAVTNAEIEELYRAVPLGTRIVIVR